MRIAIIGTGYVGLVSGACFSDFGHDVICVDKDAARSTRSSAASCRSSSPGSTSWSRATSPAGRLAFTTDLAGRGRRRRGDLHRGRHALAPRRRPCRPLLRLRRRARDRRRCSTGPAVVVTKSTVPVGTGDEVERILREVAPDAAVCGRLQPRIPARGRGDRGFQASRPDRRSAPRTSAPPR